MSYEVFVFMAGMIVGVLLFLAGYRYGLTITNNSEHNVNRSKPTFKQKISKKKLDKQQDEKSRKAQILLDNIDAYDGSGNGQKEII